MAPGPRNTHAAKTEQERSEYRDTVIKPQPMPTIELLPQSASDSTAAVMSTGTTPTLQAVSHKPTRRASASKGFFSLPNLLSGGVLLTTLVWGGSQIYALNREVGELREQLAAVARAHEQEKAEARAALATAEGRLQQRIVGLENRIDGVVAARAH